MIGWHLLLGQMWSLCRLGGPLCMLVQGLTNEHILMTIGIGETISELRA